MKRPVRDDITAKTLLKKQHFGHLIANVEPTNYFLDLLKPRFTGVQSFQIHMLSLVDVQPGEQAMTIN